MEVVVTMAVLIVITIALGHLLATYSGPLSGTYFDALLASPFIFVIAALVFVHFQLRRFRRRTTE